MTHFYLLLTALLLGPGLLPATQAQSLGRAGSPNDITTPCTAGTVLMGGGPDVDAAFTWMISRSGGGDFVVIRATGTAAYNSYIYGLGPANSVETFLVNSVALANDPALVAAVRRAEAVFFAGGDQNDYISNYRGTALGAALDYLANVKHAPIGGTSAGLAIQGYIYYDGITNVTSPNALANPYVSGTGLHYGDFLHNPFLQNTICESHFNTRGGTTANGITGRQGRLVSFLARMITDAGLRDVKAVACDERTALCVDDNGLAMVVGLGRAYFLRQWCAGPETCLNGQPLTFRSGVRTYVLPGPGTYTAPPTPARALPLATWTGGSGGSYEYWTVSAGVLTLGQPTGTPAVCALAAAPASEAPLLSVFPNPASGQLTVVFGQPLPGARLLLHDALGRLVRQQPAAPGPQTVLDLTGLAPGLYGLEVRSANGRARQLVRVGE